MLLRISVYAVLLCAAATPSTAQFVSLLRARETITSVAELRAALLQAAACLADEAACSETIVRSASCAETTANAGKPCWNASFNRSFASGHVWSCYSSSSMFINGVQQDKSKGVELRCADGVWTVMQTRPSEALLATLPTMAYLKCTQN